MDTLNPEVIILDKEKQKRNEKNQELIDHYDYLKNAASSTDCTGLDPGAARIRGRSLMPTMMFINIRLHSSNQNHRGITPGYCSVTHPLSNHDNLTKNVVLRQTKCYNVFIVGKTSHNK